MTTNIVVTLIWTLATNATVVSRVLTKPLPLEGETMHYMIPPDLGTIQRTTRFSIVSNLTGHFVLMGHKGAIPLMSLPVTNWTVTTTEPPYNVHFLPAVQAVTTPNSLDVP